MSTAPKKKLAQVIAFTNQKGGVGKSTLSFHQALFLKECGYSVLVIDLDGQGNLSSRFLPGERVGGIPTVALFDKNEPLVAPLKSDLGVDVIYSQNGDNALYEVDMNGLEQLDAFYSKVKELSEQYDFTIIDTPPAYGVKMIAACIVADYIFAPVELAGFAVDGVLALNKSLGEISQLLGQEITLAGLICNKFITRADEHVGALDAIRSQVGDLLLESVVKYSAPIDVAILERRPVWAVRKTGSQRAAAKMMLDLMKEVAGRVDVPKSVIQGFGK